MEVKHLIQELENTRAYFLRSISALREEDSAYSPQPELMTVAAHVRHTAHTIDWFMEGAFGKGFDMDFDALDKDAKSATSLGAEVEHFKEAMARAKKVFSEKSEAELAVCLPEDGIIQGPKYLILVSLADHTAHHRGALGMYARLLGRVPPMPYMGEEV